MCAESYSGEEGCGKKHYKGGQYIAVALQDPWLEAEGALPSASAVSLKVCFLSQLPVYVCWQASTGSKGQSLLAVVTRSSESASCIM